MHWRVWVLAVILVGTAPTNLAPMSAAPMWPGARFTETDRTRAITRGLAFIYRTALVPANFRDHGYDYLWCFYEIASTARDLRVSATARAMGRERARQWRREHPDLPQDTSASDLTDLAFGSYAADMLGFSDPRLKEQIRRAAARFTPVDFLNFDPAVEPPPSDLPATCEYCSEENHRGATKCHKCGRPLKMLNRFDLMCDALINTYTGDKFGVTFGRPYRDVFRWLPSLRPYDRAEATLDQQVNLVTHIVYTLNDYEANSLSPAWLPYEFGFLKEHVGSPPVLADGELLGEFLDTLRSFGMTTANDSIRAGFTVLLTTQNPDGSWGDPKAADIYDRYHPTWTAIDGLRDYRWRTRGISFPELGSPPYD
jgi:hypothetical protein